MNPRTKFRWKCVLQSEAGETVEAMVEAYWSPDKDFITAESIAGCAVGEEYLRRGKQVRFAGISAQLV